MVKRASLFLYLMLCFWLAITPGVGNTTEESDSAGIGEQSLKMGDPQLDTLWVDEKNGDYIPLESVFRDENGKSVTLAELIDRPTLILPVYFYCPNSCSLNLVNLATAIKRSRLKPGEDYGVIAFSFNEEENDENARIAKKNYLHLLPQDFPAEKWKFLTGSKENIDAVINSIGYTYKPMGDGTFIHPSALVAVAKDGKIIKYVYGTFASGDVDMAVSEARKGTPALSVKRFLGYCFNYSPQKSRSFFYYLKISVLAGFAVIGLLFFVYVKRSGKKRKGSIDEH